MGLWPFGSKQRPSSHPQPHPIPLGCAFAANAHRGCCPGNLPPQEGSGSGLRPRAASRPQQRPSPMPWPLWLCPAWPASPSVLFLGMGTQVRSPGCSRGPCTGTGSLRSLAGLTPAAEQPRAAATPGASDGEREGILLSGGGEIRAGALPREPRVTRGPSLSLEKPPTSQARPLPSVGRGCRCARGKWRRRAGRS